MSDQPPASKLSQPQPQFIVPQELAKFSISKSEFLAQNLKFQNLAVGAMVFHKDRLLLVQRSASERAFPNLWVSSLTFLITARPQLIYLSFFIGGSRWFLRGFR